MARKVLLADDSVAVRKAVEATLGPKDFEVISVRKGAEALREAKRIHPDVILLDCDLPDVDGYETCRRLKRDPDLQGIPVLLMNSDGEDEGASARAQQAGAEGYLTKPFQGKALADQVLSLADMSFDPTLRIDSAEMATLGLGDEIAGLEEDLDLGDLDLEGADVLCVAGYFHARHGRHRSVRTAAPDDQHRADAHRHADRARHTSAPRAVQSRRCDRFLGQAV